MVSQGVGSITKMEGNTEDVDEELENVRHSYSLGYCHGCFVKGALDEHVPRQENGGDGDPKLCTGIKVYM